VARGKPAPSPQPLPDVETRRHPRDCPSARAARPSVPSASKATSASLTGEFALADVLAQARRLKAACGARAVELDAYNINTYSGLAPLVEQCARLFDAVSFKSQRADAIAACPQIFDLERAAGKNAPTPSASRA
jgi:hypothetical protein